MHGKCTLAAAIIAALAAGRLQPIDVGQAPLRFSRAKAKRLPGQRLAPCGYTATCGGRSDARNSHRGRSSAYLGLLG